MEAGAARLYHIIMQKASGEQLLFMHGIEKKAEERIHAIVILIV